MCGSRGHTGAKGFFRFPTDKIQRQNWLHFCGLTSEDVKENDKIVDDGKDWREEQIYLGSPQSGLSGNL